MAVHEETQKFAVGDRARIKMHGTPVSWRGREVRITANETGTHEAVSVYHVEWVEDNTGTTAFYGHELEPVKPEASKTINIDVNLDFDVETVVSNLRVSIAQSLRALADEIEEPQ